MSNKNKKIVGDNNMINEINEDLIKSEIVQELEAKKNIESKEKVVEPNFSDMMAEMMSKIKSLEKELESSKQQQVTSPVVSYVNPNLIRYIPVISLLANVLNLSTDPHNKTGSATKYKFEYFGHELPIPYDDLHKIVNSHNRFFTEGKCYILDSDFVKSEKLEKQYEKLVGKDTFDKLLKADIKTFKNIYNSMIDSQKEILRGVFISKINKGEQFDMNIISFIDSEIDSENKKLMTAINAYRKKDEVE